MKSEHNERLGELSRLPLRKIFHFSFISPYVIIFKILRFIVKFINQNEFNEKDFKNSNILYSIHNISKEQDERLCSVYAKLEFKCFLTIN